MSPNSKDYRTYTCYGCHEHSRSKIREKHVEEGITDYENCIECHRHGEADEGKLEGRGGNDRHSRAGGSQAESGGKGEHDKESKEHHD